MHGCLSMFANRRWTWLAFFLFWLTQTVSVLLILLVIVAPVLDNESQRLEGGSRWLTLFACDGAVRRTAAASALGLAVTACVFFRPPGRTRPRPRRKPDPPPPPDIAGA